MRVSAAPAIVVIAAATFACGGTPTHQHTAGPLPSAAMTPAVQSGLAKVRAATNRFHALDSAVAAGYARDVPRCYGYAEGPAMGYHHINRTLVDRQVDLDHPEILLYERKGDGSYVLNGVEFIIPYRLWPADSTPPQLMGVNMMNEDELHLWYLHMWTWKENPYGLFDAYNPSVRCPAPRG